MCFFLEHHEGVRFHACGESQGKKSFRVAAIFCQALFGEFSRLVQRILKALHPLRIRLPFNSVQESLLIQKKSLESTP